MSSQTVFKRYELKYFMTIEQYVMLKSIMQDTMKIDAFGMNTIHNIYFDTPDYRLIRKSLEKPCYKEKLRVRSYGTLGDETPLFVELKKKYNGVVYKRRMELPYEEAFDFLLHQIPLHEETQIAKELSYFMEFYGNLAPALLLSYEREAYYGKEDPEFRMTFDHNIRIKTEDILQNDCGDITHVLEDDRVLLEIKTGLAIPTWLLHFLSSNQIYKTSFSKYGTAYQKILLPKLKGEKIYVA
ncbi:MAG: polyphosphate polymerase domain-containing protein [Lachnospiraceae bacterium]